MPDPVPSESSAASIPTLASRFRDALADPAQVRALLSAAAIDGREVHDFPAPSRPTDGRPRLGLLLLLRATAADLIARPDLVLTGRSHVVSPDIEGAGDHDLVHDVVIEHGDLDLEVSPSVVLARLGIHASSFGGIDPDPLYVPQTMLFAATAGDGEVTLLRANLSVPIHDAEMTLPSSDVRDDLESLRGRIWRQYAYVQLLQQVR